MTQEELAGKLNVTRQALSNWERDVNEPDLNTLKKICFLFGVHMDDFAKEVITKMETYEKKEKRQFNKYDMAIGLFYGVGIFLGIGIFFVGGFMTEKTRKQDMSSFVISSQCNNCMAYQAKYKRKTATAK